MGKKINVIIIGAGQIGAFYDSPVEKEILTHAHAFSSHKGFKLLGFIDKDHNRAKKAGKIWKARVFDDIESASKLDRIDVVVIAVPDELHYKILKRVAELPVKLVFVEKPFTRTLKEANEIIKLYKKRKIRIMVNYRRRFVPEYEKIGFEINKGKYGKYLAGNAYYGKGMLHNGTHVVDLLRYLLGEINSGVCFNREYDHKRSDPSASCVLKLKNGGRCVLQAIDSEKYTIMEWDMLFEKGRIRIIDSGFAINMSGVESSKIFKGYKNLTKEKEKITSLGKTMLYAADNIYEHLTHGEKLKCSAMDGVKAMEIALGLRKMAKR